MLGYPVTFGHNSFLMNGHLNADGSVNANVQNTVVIDERTIDTMFREGRDAYHLTTGGSLGRAHKGFTVLRLRGRILVPDATQNATRSDGERAMLAAFDPALCYRDSPATDGAYALDFSEPTADTTAYVSGLIPLRYWCRPMGRPSTVERLADGTLLSYALGLIAPDPRCYEQEEQTLVLTPGAPIGAVVNRGNVPAPLRVTIVMAGAGHASFTITRGVGSSTGQASLVANYSFEDGTYLGAIDGWTLVSTAGQDWSYQHDANAVDGTKTCVTHAWTGAGNFSYAKSDPFTVTAGETLFLSASFYPEHTSSRGVYFGLEFYDSGGGSLGSLDVLSDGSTVGGVRQTPAGYLTAPAGAVTARVGLTIDDPSANNMLWWDRIIVQRAAVAFVLNLSTATAGQSIIVVMETCGPYGQGRRVTKAGVDTFSLKTSSPSTWLDAVVGYSMFTISNTTNVTSATLAWHSARA